MELYEQNGGTTLSRRTLLEKVEGQFGDDIMVFHSRRVATLVIFKDDVASMLNIEHTKDDDEVTLKKLGEETSQESRTVKEELKSYQDYLVMTADMQIYKIIFNIMGLIMPYWLQLWTRCFHAFPLLTDTSRFGLFFCHSLTYLPNEVEQQFLRGEYILHHSDGL